MLFFCCVFGGCTIFRAHFRVQNLHMSVIICNVLTYVCMYVYVCVMCIFMCMFDACCMSRVYVSDL